MRPKQHETAGWNDLFRARLDQIPPGASKAAMMIKQPALAPSPQPRPAPTVRALPAELAVQRSPFGCR